MFRKKYRNKRNNKNEKNSISPEKYFHFYKIEKPSIMNLIRKELLQSPIKQYLSIWSDIQVLKWYKEDILSDFPWPNTGIEWKEKYNNACKELRLTNKLIKINNEK